MSRRRRHRVAQGRRRRRPRRRPGPHGRRRPAHDRADAASADAYGALDNRCPHQGGPLGEGSHRERLAALPVARLRLRPAHRRRPRRVSTTPRRAFPVEVRDDGVYVELPASTRARPHRVRRRRRDAGRVGDHPRVRHGRALQPRVRRRAAPGRAARRAHLHRHPPRRRGRVRRVRLRQAHRPPGGLLRDRRAGFDQPAHRSVRRQGRPRPGRSRSPARCRRRCSAAARSKTSTSARRSPTSPRSTATVQAGSDHAELTALAVKHALDERGGRPSRAARRGAGAAGDRRSRVHGPTGRARRPSRSLAAAARARPGGRGRRAGARRPVIIVGHGARGAIDRRRRARRTARRPGADHVQGQGPGPRQPPARRRRARAQRHAGRVVADERSPTCCSWSAPRSPTTPASRRTSRSSRSTTTRRASAASTRSTVGVLGDVGRHRSALRRTARPGGRSESTSAATSPSAGRSGAPRRPGGLADDRGDGRRLGRGLRRARRPSARRTR